MFNEINTDLELVHYPFPSIGQFANTIYNINHKAHYVGQDEDNEPIYDKCLPMPTLKFVGTTKLHGTNAGIIIDFAKEIVYFQSRENIISPMKDNAGCASFLASIQKDIVNMVKSNLDITAIDWTKNVLGIYGEWCGGSIQKGVALNQLEKMFVIFAIATINTETKQKTWFIKEVVEEYKLTDKKVFNIFDYKTYEIEIDFEKHYESTNKLVEMTIEVEDMCPFSKAFGVEGIGEGIVFQCVTAPYSGDSGFWFKSKGEKHSKSKVKVVRQVDNEKIEKLLILADKLTPSWRLEQMLNNTFDFMNGGQLTRTKMGDYMKAVNNDICKEEMQTIVDSGIEFKDIANYVGKISRDYFFQMEKEMLNTPL